MMTAPSSRWSSRVSRPWSYPALPRLIFLPTWFSTSVAYARARCLNEILSRREARSRVDDRSLLGVRWAAALNPFASETLDELRCASAGHLGCRILPDATPAPAACCEKSFLDAAPHDFRLSDSQQSDSRWDDKALRQTAPLPLHDR